MGLDVQNAVQWPTREYRGMGGTEEGGGGVGGKTCSPITAMKGERQ